MQINNSLAQISNNQRLNNAARVNNQPSFSGTIKPAAADAFIKETKKFSSNVGEQNQIVKAFTKIIDRVKQSQVLDVDGISKANGFDFTFVDKTKVGKPIDGKLSFSLKGLEETPEGVMAKIDIPGGGKVQLNDPELPINGFVDVFIDELDKQEAKVLGKAVKS